MGHKVHRIEIDIQKIGCDFYAISCHKMYGPKWSWYIVHEKIKLMIYPHIKVAVV